MKVLMSIGGILAANATFIVALLGLLLLAGGVAMKIDTPTALIAAGALILLDTFLETRSPPRDR